MYEFETKQQRDWYKQEESEPVIQQEIMFTPIEDIAKKEAELNISAPVEKVENSPVTVEKPTVSNGWAAFDSEPKQVKEYVTFCSGD